MRKVLVIGGPTATGKSELAVDVARLFDGEVINADSVQIYRGMDIGTAKPPPEMRRVVPHHLFDVATCDDPWDVKRYEVEAVRVIEDVLSRGRLPVLVGGSGFYIEGVLCGVPPDAPSDPELRRKLLSKDKHELYRMLGELDPKRASQLHPNDVKRVVRALEICLLTGRPASSFVWSGEERWDVLRIALDRERSELKERIYRRVDRMMEMGWLEEVRRLVSLYGRDNRVLRETLGYRELVMHLEGRLSLEEAVALIKTNTWRYSKRQRRWFASRGFLFFNAEDREAVVRRVEEWLNDKDNGG